MHWCRTPVVQNDVKAIAIRVGVSKISQNSYNCIVEQNRPVVCESNRARLAAEDSTKGVDRVKRKLVSLRGVR